MIGTVGIAVTVVTAISAVGPAAAADLTVKAGTAQLLALGANADGQLGTGTTTNSAVPVSVGGRAGNAKAIAVNGSSLALLPNGRVLQWGYQIQPTGSTSTPTLVPGLSDVSQLAAGGLFALALRRDGTVAGWGYNYQGQLGNGTQDSATTPTTVSGLTGVRAVSARADHALALTSDGRVWRWGQSTRVAQTVDLVPRRVPGLTGVVAVSAGATFDLALRSDGTVFAWGQNKLGQLGLSTHGSAVAVPTMVRLPRAATAISAGDSAGMAVLNDGTVAAWGANVDGQLGLPHAEVVDTPVAVPGLSQVGSVTLSGNAAVILRRDGQVLRLGALYDETGRPLLPFVSAPTPVPGLDHVSAVTGNDDHVLAIRQAP